MITKVLITIIVIALGVGAFFMFKDKSDTQATPLINGPIIAFGDSLVYGYGATSGADFVSVLSQEINKPILNLGVNGNTTQGGLDRLQIALDQKPSVVLLLLGGNDFLRQVPIEQTFQNLSSIIEQLQAGGAKVILLGIQGGVFNDPYKEKFEALAKTYNTPYVPNVLAGIVNDTSLMSDAVHPNDAGYKKIADRVYPVVKDVIGK